MPRTSAIMLACVIWTPFGGPVVPEVSISVRTSSGSTARQADSKSKPQVCALLELGQRDRSLLRAVDEHDPLDRDPAAPDRCPDLREEGSLGDDHASTRVGEQVLDLLRRGRVVDRERHRTQVQRGGVHEVELRRLTSMSATASPRPTPRPPDRPRFGAPARRTPETDRHAVARRAQRDLIAALRGRDLKRLAQVVVPSAAGAAACAAVVTIASLLFSEPSPAAASLRTTAILSAWPADGNGRTLLIAHCGTRWRRCGALRSSDSWLV